MADKELLVLGTGPSLKDKTLYKELINEIDSLTWGASFDFVKRSNYFSYIDPASATKPLDFLSKKDIGCEIKIINPIVNKNLKTFKQYLRTTRLKNDKLFNNYLKKLKKASETNGSSEVNFTTLKKIQKTDPGLYNKDLDGKEYYLRFSDPFVVGMKNKLSFKKNKRLEIMNHYENKLTMFILPLCYKMGYKKIYLVGFDGFGGRYYNKSLMHPEKAMKKTYEGFLPMWMNEWKETHGMEIISLMKKSVINKYVKCLNE